MGFSSPTLSHHGRDFPHFANVSLLQVEGGQAASCGHIRRGDQILRVGDADLSRAHQQEAVTVIRATASGRVRIKFRRGVTE